MAKPKLIWSNWSSEAAFHGPQCDSCGWVYDPWQPVDPCRPATCYDEAASLSCRAKIEGEFANHDCAKYPILPQAEPKTMLTTEQASEYLGVAPGTLRQWRHEKRGPKYYKYSSILVRYRLEDLQQFLDAGAVEPKK